MRLVPKRRKMPSQHHRGAIAMSALGVVAFGVAVNESSHANHKYGPVFVVFGSLGLLLFSLGLRQIVRAQPQAKTRAGVPGDEMSSKLLEAFGLAEGQSAHITPTARLYIEQLDENRRLRVALGFYAAEGSWEGRRLTGITEFHPWSLARVALAEAPPQSDEEILAEVRRGLSARRVY
jgi:hypothetical protein